MENMQIYNASRSVPQEAQKTIGAGRLKGMTDINPMWRIKALTEQFGACGIGWYFTTDRQWTEQIGNEVVACVNISLFIKVDDEWSKPIFGTGGSKLATMEKSGQYVSDEAFKMATTDAISVACKNLGFAADIYWNKDRTKYTAPEEKSEKQMKDEEHFEDVGNMKIAKIKVDSLKKKCDTDGVKIEKVCEFCKVKKPEELTEKLYSNIINHWDDVKAKCV